MFFLPFVANYKAKSQRAWRAMSLRWYAFIIFHTSKTPLELAVCSEISSWIRNPDEQNAQINLVTDRKESGHKSF